MNQRREAQAALITENTELLRDSAYDGTYITDRLGRRWWFDPRPPHSKFYRGHTKLSVLQYGPVVPSVRVTILDVPIDVEHMIISVGDVITNHQLELIRVGDAVANGEISPFGLAAVKAGVAENWDGDWSAFTRGWLKVQFAGLASGTIDPLIYTEHERMILTYHRYPKDRRVMFKPWRDKSRGVYGLRNGATSTEEHDQTWDEWIGVWNRTQQSAQDSSARGTKRPASAISARLVYV